MKQINLAYPDKSTIKFKVNNYPDGQRDIVIDNIIEYSDGVDYWTEHLSVKDAITIKSRLNNMEDLGLIICATKALRNLGVKEIHLFVPYIMGLRSDRLFERGGVRYIKDVLAPLLNSLDFASVTCYDAHSYVAENCINNLNVIDNRQLVHWALAERYSNEMKQPIINLKEFILVSPDDGASKKIYKVAEKIGYKGDIIICSKARDVNGKLTKTVVPMSIDYWNTKDKIIIDDICDGGITFINIVKELKKEAYLESKKGSNNGCKIYLIVTHGIFSAGFEELTKYFDGIYCTNSYKDVGDMEQLSPTKLIPTKVKQLNVF